MLVTFRTAAHASITMFGDVAEALIRLMGHSGTIPGAILADEVPAALERLRQAVAIQPDRPLDPATVREDDDGARVSLAQRARPLIELLSTAAREGDYVMWDLP